MGLFSRLFSSKSDLPALRKAVSQQRYADALLIVEELQDSELSAEERSEVKTLKAQAGDSLAKVNLDEGLYLLKDQQIERAMEHLQLAQQQAFSEDLKHQAEQALQQVDEQQPIPVAAAAASSCSSCSSCGPTDSDQAAPLSDEDHPDMDAQLELILTSYPEELVSRYQQKCADFQKAFVLGHQGEEIEAMKAFGKLPASEQDDLFDFEVGCIMARLGERGKACDALYSALKQNPNLLLATESMVSILVSLKKYQTAIDLIQEMMGKGQDAGFCEAQLASVYHVKDEADNALSHGLKALEAGYSDTRIVLMCAMLHEAKEQFTEAEALYRKIPAGGGCGGGGMNLYLAEFLMRQKRDLRKVLDTFNNACRQEPDNPRWQLRVAQTYLGLGWDKRGKDLLNIVLRDPNLMEELRTEGQSLLATL
ncbi:hypothetical protein HTZ97_14160 [Desulfuromonas acetoxidans]|uniref:tetratricopeptide repeat protein n=1 Tax=Desulfuromonas acetoxidans TaxID=891 RepID=UPI001592B195|nr:hypothetical protein [Desulfuromonas acetoxidans]MBF0645285.1 hypothetical protein [Desulfuromonas acetoxidans]NVD25591.1 hypothetical protein [Desulfuromonas acetoxidans]NVE17599.1 hypothetical protein [Desulfuromonas acetoxidans]